jgi:Mg2+ and Co2+ transporter CorA
MQEPENDKAPFFKSWNSWYFLVLLFLLVLIILFYLLTQRFS